MTTRTRRFGIALLGVAALVAVVGTRFRDRHEPRFEGRTARAWFQELVRVRNSMAHGGAGDDPGDDHARHWRARLALLELGTNTLPFLLDRAFENRPDSAPREAVCAVLLELPAWAGRGAFAPHWVSSEVALDLLQDLRPPAEPLLAATEPVLRSGAAGLRQRQTALRILGAAGSGRDRVLPWLLPAIASTNLASTYERQIAVGSLHLLDVDPAVALPAVRAALRDPQFRPSGALHLWLRHHAPATAAAVPELEGRFADAGIDYRLQAAVTVLHLQPGHAEALRLVTTAATQVNPPASHLEALCTAVYGGERVAERIRPCPELAPIFENLARTELREWDAGRGDTWIAMRAFAHVAPARAAALYREALGGPAGGLAAGSLLRLEPTNAEAARVLIAMTRERGRYHRSQFLGLGEASSANREAMAALEQLAAGPASDPLRADARAVLARIAFRECRERKGLPPRP